MRLCLLLRCVLTHDSLRREGAGKADRVQYTSSYLPSATLKSNYTSNSTKSLITSVEASLKKLKTSYIDILYLHWWDHTTSVEEVMKALNTLADQGKILYLGVSDTPAWVVAKGKVPDLMRW